MNNKARMKKSALFAAAVMIFSGMANIPFVSAPAAVTAFAVEDEEEVPVPMETEAPAPSNNQSSKKHEYVTVFDKKVSKDIALVDIYGEESENYCICDDSSAHIGVGSKKDLDISVLKNFRKTKTLIVQNYVSGKKELEELVDLILKYMPELEYLEISSYAAKNGMDYVDETKLNMFSDITPLSKLSGTKITSLSLGPNKISDISPLASLKNLEKIDIYQNNIKDISPLSKLKKLKFLSISNDGCFSKKHGVTGNKIKDLSPLAKLTKLENLYLRDCGISNIKPLANLKNLEVLYLSNNNISNISSISKLKKLEYLNITGNKKVKKSAVNSLKKKLPNCNIVSDYD